MRVFSYLPLLLVCLVACDVCDAVGSGDISVVLGLRLGVPLGRGYFGPVCSDDVTFSFLGPWFRVDRVSSPARRSVMCSRASSERSSVVPGDMFDRSVVSRPSVPLRRVPCVWDVLRCVPLVLAVGVFFPTWCGRVHVSSVLSPSGVSATASCRTLCALGVFLVARTNSLLRFVALYFVRIASSVVGMHCDVSSGWRRTACRCGAFWYVFVCVVFVFAWD